jgi:hypothetical protein
MAKKLLALGLALTADALQILLSPLLAVGMGEGIDAGIDVTMCLLLTWLRGFHWVFLPTFLAELIPGIDLAPFWALAVIFTWKDKPTLNPEKSLPEPKL